MDAIYLAGYVVEFAFKALILTGTPEHKCKEVFKRYFKGREGHNLESLRAILREKGYNMSVQLTEEFRRVASWWSTDLRYQVGSVGAKEAQEFLRAIDAIHKWVEKSF